ncbi:MAG: T9SS type A sorting domain-containing protein [Bacteroidota bacterium]
MKKFYTVIAAALVGTMAIAQNGRTSFPVPQTLTFNSPLSTEAMPPTDTLWGNLANWTGAVLNGSAGGGYVTGNNGYGDKQKAQSFLVTGPALTIYGNIMWFGAKEVTSGNPNSNIKVRIYNMNGTGTTSAGTGQPAPNTVLLSDQVLITAVDTSSNLSLAYIHTFSAPTFVSSDFAVGFDVTGLAPGDTIGMVNSPDGEAGAPDQSWDQWSDNTWHSYFEANNWNLNCDQGQFPIVDMQSGIEEMGFLNGVKVATYPNPATDKVSITYELMNDAKKVEIKILDATGKVIAVINEGEKCAGQHKVDIDATTLAAGTYYVTLQAGNGKMAVALVIE